MIKKIGYIILSFFLTRVLFIGTGFNTIINLSKNNIIIVSILGMLLGLLILYFLYKKKKINKILSITISIFVLIIISLNNISLTTNYLLIKTPIWLILLSIFLLCIYGSSKKMITTSRISSIIITPTILLIIFSLWGLSSLVELNNLLPLFNSSIKNTIIGILSFSALSTIPNIILLNYKNNLSFKDISIGYIIGSLFITLLLFYIISIYGYELSSISKYPEYLILKKVFIISNINNLENILILEWISCIVMTILVCMNYLRDTLNKKVFYTIITIIFILILFILHKLYFITILIQNYINYIFLVLIILCLILPSFKKKS